MYLRIEDKTVISRMIYNDFMLDQATIAAKFPRYLTPFETNFLNKIEAAEGVVHTKLFTTQLSTVTRLLEVTSHSIREDLDNIEMMAINCGDTLSIAVKDMGFMGVRLNITNGNMEGLLIAANILFANIDSNNAALTVEGLTPAILTGLKDKVVQVKKLNEKQDTLLGARASAVEGNSILFEEMWAITTNVSKAGKVTFKVSSPARAKEYVINTKLKRIRQDGNGTEAEAQKKAELAEANLGQLELTVKDFGIDDSWVDGAEVEIQGTDDKYVTDDDGKLVVDLATGTYNLIIRMDTYEDKVVTAVIKAGETNEMVVELKALQE